MNKTCFWMAVPKRERVGKALTFSAMGRRRFADYIDYAGTPRYCAIIRGYAKKIEGIPTHEVFFMPNDTPYVVWREPGSTSRCYMKLDLQNPQECKDVTGTAQQILDIVAEHIKDEGTSGYPANVPSSDVRRFLRTMRG